MPKDQPYLAAEKKIKEALKSGATELDLSNSQYKDPKPPQLTELPDSLWKLTQLTDLNLSHNQLTTLPDSLLAQLTQLTVLNLASNQLTALPDSLGQLTQLKSLDLSINQLTTLPDSLGQLTQLQSLALSSNQLTALPEWLEQLTDLKEIIWIGLEVLPVQICRLQKLELLVLGGGTYQHRKGTITMWLPSNNKYAFRQLPNEIGDLTSLKALLLGSCQITDLPPSLAQLEHLTTLSLDNNPLNPALQSAYKQGLPAVKAYLRSLEQNAEPLYEAKLVLVGEGNVGKTTLLKALKGKAGAAPQEHEPTTHGVEIDIHGLRLPHPAQNGVEIQLNAWDFGGQDVYRVTHQFFFSHRSLYLLVWEPRRGVQQGQVEDWLNMIRLRVGDDARVIIVSTHCKTGQRIARIDKPVLIQQYGDMIVGFHEVDSLVPDKKTGEMVGIAKLKKIIAQEAAKLEQMGMGFNRDWKAARDELLQLPEPRIAYSVFREVCARYGLSEIDTSTLARLMHDLGYIVHYSEDEKLRDDVVLKPQWLTKAIGFVLEDRATAEHEGILPDKHLYEVWHDHPFKGEQQYDPSLYPFFLRLMEKYDVSYRLPEGNASLVAQHVPQVRPNLPWLPEQEPPKKQRRIAMVCSMEEDPPGLVPWMIVRTHDYANLHWQKGMFLNHGAHGTAMLEKRGLEFHVYAQATYPEYFMNILQNTLEKLITDNWPGMKERYRFNVPCPEVKDGLPCKGRFNIHTLRQFLAEGDTTIRCQECTTRHSIAKLLLGFEERSVDAKLQEINQKLDGLDSRIADVFMAMMRAIANEGKNGPRLFTFRSRDAGLSPKQFFSRPLELQLWCEHEDRPHPVIESGKGIYSIDQPYEWVKAVAPYANIVLDVLKTFAPMAAPAINIFKDSKITEKWKDEIDLTKAIIDKLPAEIKASDRGFTPGKQISETERSGILALHNLLKELDPSQSKIGLHRVATYTGDYRWLCKHHYDAWQPNIPDVIPSHE